MNAEDYIQSLNLQAHPEGGYYCRVYQSAQQAQFPGFEGPRFLSTAIHYLLIEDQYSAWHKIKSDELWILSDSNTTVRLHEIVGDEIKITSINKSKPFYTVPAGHWFAAELDTKGADKFALCHCVVSPGFDFSDFKMADESLLDELKPEMQITARKLLPTSS